MKPIFLTKSIRPISKLIFHHFGDHPPDGMNIAKIRPMHTLPKPEGRDFDDVAYHGGIMPDGEFQIGRPVDKMGAHAKGANKGSIGIVFIAGIKPGASHTVPTQAQLTTARLIIEEQKGYYPGLELLGHRDTGATKCPGFDIRHWYETNEVRP